MVEVGVNTTDVSLAVALDIAVAAWDGSSFAAWAGKTQKYWKNSPSTISSDHAPAG
jgi:hypothetical protein